MVELGRLIDALKEEFGAMAIGCAVEKCADSGVYLEAEEEALQSAAVLNSLDEELVEYEPIGSAGRLLAVQGHLDLRTGEIATLLGFCDTSTGSLVCTAAVSARARNRVIMGGTSS
jgi:hypothetical protein